jgi:hypothetical protein
MRKKRAWSTRKDDVDSQETAAFEAAVAAARDTAVKSGEFLSNAKSDLTEHRRWLKAQSAAVERDRARHERWLERQSDRRAAIERKEHTRLQRQARRERASQAAGASAGYVTSLFLDAIASIGASIKYVVVSIGRGFAFVGANLRDGTLYVAHLIGAGVGWVAAKVKASVLAIGAMVAAAFTWSGGKALASGRAGGAALSTGSAFVSSKTVSSVRSGGKALASALAFVSAKVQSSARAGGSVLAAGSTAVASKAQSSARVGGSALAAGSSLVASKADVFTKSAGRSLGAGFSVASAKGAGLTAAMGTSASRGFSVVSDNASALTAASKRRLSAGFAWSKAGALKLAPALSVHLANVGRQAERYAKAGASHAKHGLDKAKGGLDKAKAPVPTRGGAPATVTEVYGPFYEGFWVEGVSRNEPQGLVPEDVAPRVGRQNALSSWAQALQGQGARVRNAWAENPFVKNERARTRDVELSQMMIIAGAVLLVCGGLLLGGGFALRAGASATPGAGTATPEVSGEALDGIAWTFEDLDRPLPDRAVFTLSGTPEAFRINGLSITGTNQSDQALTGVHAILKPDVQRPDLKLILQVDGLTGSAGEDAAEALDVVPANTVPAHAPFRLVFPFPPEAMDGEDGITVAEFFDSYGGLLLKFRYEIDGKQKSLIQYLPPDLLEAQLDEVVAEASGS